MLEIILDERDFASPSDVHELLADQLDFPNYYGQNLSALWDCLGDLDDDVSFIVIRIDDAAARQEWFDRLVRVLVRADEQLDNIQTIVR